MNSYWSFFIGQKLMTALFLCQVLTQGLRHMPHLPNILFLFIFKGNLLQIHTTHYTTYNLLNNTTRTIPRSARCHDNSAAIDMNNK